MPLTKNLSIPSITAIIKHKNAPKPNKKILVKINIFFNYF